MWHHRLFAVLVTFAVVALLAGCGSGGPATSLTIQPAHIFGLSGFKPSGPVRPGRRTVVSFTIHTPSGGTLTQYKECCDPHAGVDLIIVRDDDSHVQYIDADAEPDGRVSVPVTFPTSGRYRIVVDAYPKVAGPEHPVQLPALQVGDRTAASTTRSRFRPTGRPRWSTATASPFRATHI